MMFLRAAAFAAALLFGAAGVSTAHPDIAVTARVLFDLDGGRLTGVAVRWAFDAGYSARLAARYDVDGDGAFDGGEVDALRRRLAADLSPHDFFIELSTGGSLVDLGEPVGFHAVLENGIVSVTAAFPLLHVLPLTAGRRAELMLRDVDYIAAFRWAQEQPALVRGDENGRCAVDLQERPGRAYFGGLVRPIVATLSCR